MPCDIVVNNRTIGKTHPPYVVAELSANHNQSLERALQLVDLAAAAGVDAVKIQTYTADTMTLDRKDGNFFISDPQSLWCGRTLHDLYQEAHTPWEWHKPILDRCRERGIAGFSTPFDESAVDFLEELDVPCYKIASFENTDIPLLRRVARTGKPVIVSTGMAALGELEECAATLRSNGCTQIILLKCTSSYPAPADDINLATIGHLEQMFDCQVGLSDHTLGIGVSVAAVALGAVFVEKHFTSARADGGVDSAFAMEPEELRMLVAECRQAWQARGGIRYGVTSRESKSLQFRRSLYVVKALNAGDALSLENVRCLRPAGGLEPRYLDVILGKRVNRAVVAGTPLTWEILG